MTTTKICHISPKKAFEADGVEYWGSDNKSLDKLPLGTLIVNLTSICDDVLAVTNFPGLEAWLWRSVQIETTDQKAPPVPKEFWLELVAAVKKNKVTVVCIHCLGGHGRTGTVLAVLAGLLSKTTGCPVTYIRKIYCEEAVESEAQITYIEELTGLKVKAKAGRSWSGAINAYNYHFPKEEGGWGDDLPSYKNIGGKLVKTKPSQKGKSKFKKGAIEEVKSIIYPREAGEYLEGSGELMSFMDEDGNEWIYDKMAKTLELVELCVDSLSPDVPTSLRTKGGDGTFEEF
jgi:hypothetical protein